MAGRAMEAGTPSCQPLLGSSLLRRRPRDRGEYYGEFGSEFATAGMPRSNKTILLPEVRVGRRDLAAHRHGRVSRRRVIISVPGLDPGG